MKKHTLNPNPLASLAIAYRNRDYRQKAVKRMDKLHRFLDKAKIKTGQGK